MKVDPAIQRKLLELAAVDTELTKVNHQRRAMPELAEIDEIEKNVKGKKDALVAVQTRLGDLDRDLKRQETEIDQVRAREERDRKLLGSDTIGGKQLADIQHELTSLERRQRALEDDQLELMERREAVEADVQHAAAHLDKAEEALADAYRRRDTILADLETTEARRLAERSDLIKVFPNELLAVYERVRNQRGIGAALLRARRCEACRLELDRVALASVKTASADEVVRCEECGAILVRTAESGL